MPSVSTERLDALLRALVAEHERLLVIAGEHRAALAGADLPALNSCIIRQNEIVQRISELERERQALTGRAGPGDSPVHLSTLTASAGEPARSRLAALAARLRELLNQLHREHQMLRMAAEELSNHMEGLMRQVCRTLSHAGTYGRAGTVAAGSQVVSALDVRS